MLSLLGPNSSVGGNVGHGTGVGVCVGGIGVGVRVGVRVGMMAVGVGVPCSTRGGRVATCTAAAAGVNVAGKLGSIVAVAVSSAASATTTTPAGKVEMAICVGSDRGTAVGRACPPHPTKARSKEQETRNKEQGARGKRMKEDEL